MTLFCTSRWKGNKGKDPFGACVIIPKTSEGPVFLIPLLWYSSKSQRHKDSFLPPQWVAQTSSPWQQTGVCQEGTMQVAMGSCALTGSWFYSSFSLPSFPIFRVWISSYCQVISKEWAFPNQSRVWLPEGLAFTDLLSHELHLQQLGRLERRKLFRCVATFTL